MQVWKYILSFEIVPDPLTWIWKAGVMRVLDLSLQARLQHNNSNFKAERIHTKAFEVLNVTDRPAM